MAEHNNTCYAPLNEWITTVASNLPNLSQPQATVLALFSFGMVLAKCCALTAVVIILAPLMKVTENTLRQRLREWYYDAENKRGEKRLDVNVSSCFPGLLRWLLSLWHGQPPTPFSKGELALALDATTLSDRFVVLALSVVYRGCAIPVVVLILCGIIKSKHRLPGRFCMAIVSTLGEKSGYDCCNRSKRIFLLI